jgi:hypothetical protein
MPGDPSDVVGVVQWDSESEASAGCPTGDCRSFSSARVALLILVFSLVVFILVG